MAHKATPADIELATKTLLAAEYTDDMCDPSDDEEELTDISASWFDGSVDADLFSTYKELNLKQQHDVLQQSQPRLVGRKRQHANFSSPFALHEEPSSMRD